MTSFLAAAFVISPNRGIGAAVSSSCSKPLSAYPAAYWGRLLVPTSGRQKLLGRVSVWLKPGARLGLPGMHLAMSLHANPLISFGCFSNLQGDAIVSVLPLGAVSR